METESVTFRIPTELKEKLQAIAKKQNRSLSGQILHILQQGIKKP